MDNEQFVNVFTDGQTKSIYPKFTKKTPLLGRERKCFFCIYEYVWLQRSKPLKENIKLTDQHRYHQQQIQSCPLRFWESTTRTEQRREQPGVMLRLDKFSATIVLVVILLLFTIIVNILHHLINMAIMHLLSRFNSLNIFRSPCWSPSWEG